jgi:cyclic peptide transporter
MMILIGLLVALPLVFVQLNAGAGKGAPSMEKIASEIPGLMKEADIPGLSLAIVMGKQVYVKGFGYADLEKKKPVTPESRFELASCSKAFTALSVLKLREQGLINLEDPVSIYLPWFYVKYKKGRPEITIRQLLNHTSGIPEKSIGRIPIKDHPDALERTVKNLVGIELAHQPGTQFQYATVNYDILGLIVETVSGTTFSDYMLKNVFQPLGLAHTTVGRDNSHSTMAAGYKIGFYRPLRYDAPVYRGNHPAGYVVSNGTDMARWLQLQLGVVQTDLHPLIQETQTLNSHVPLDLSTLSTYMMGWRASIRGDGTIFHSGLNPNFSSYIAFKPREKFGIAVLVNSNSSYTTPLGNHIMRVLAGFADVKAPTPVSGLDKPCSLITFILGLYLVFSVVYLLLTLLGIFKGTRRFEPLGYRKILSCIVSIFLGGLVVFGIYLIPRAIIDSSWAFAVIWTPLSLPVAAVLAILSLAVSYINASLILIFPHTSKLKNSAPFIIILSALAGFTGGLTLLLIFNSFSDSVSLLYILYYLGASLVIVTASGKWAQSKLITLTNDLVYDLRMKLLNRVLSTTFQKFEKIDSGRVYATLNNDTEVLAGAPGLVVNVVSQLAIVIFVFIYLATLSLIPTLFTLLFIGVVVVIYSIVSKGINRLFEEVRDTQNVFMRLIEGLVKGYKELSLNRNIKKEYNEEVRETCDEYRQKRNISLIRFLHTRLFTAFMLYALLITVSIAFRYLFPQIKLFTLIAFAVALIYVIGPINVIMGAVPNTMRLRIAWKRIKGFLNDLQYVKNYKEAVLVTRERLVGRLKANDLMFSYDAENERERFTVGPINFEVGKGEVLFIIGGNGSGKTTLAKLITGLYLPDSGKIEIDDAELSQQELGECFSAVFSDFHLFKRLYNIDLDARERVIEKHLDELDLDSKVAIEDHSFSTIDLSGGQRKRLALFKVYLENNPVYLFDEIAAGQDPDFRKFFYRELIPRMKKDGKIVIAITHDDHYFDAADKIIKMDMGKIEFVKKTE